MRVQRRRSGKGSGGGNVWFRAGDAKGFEAGVLQELRGPARPTGA